MEAARDSEKKTKKQLDDTENERRRLEKALSSARDELDSTYVYTVGIIIRFWKTAKLPLP